VKQGTELRRSVRRHSDQGGTPKEIQD